MAFLNSQDPVPSQIDPKIVKLIPKSVALKYTIVPVRRDGQTLYIGTDDPRNRATLEDIAFMTGFRIEPIDMRVRDIVTALHASYELTADEERALDDIMRIFDRHDLRQPTTFVAPGNDPGFGMVINEGLVGFPPPPPAADLAPPELPRPELEQDSRSITTTVPVEIKGAGNLLPGILDQGLSPDVDAILFEPTPSGLQVRLRRGGMLVHELDIQRQDARRLMDALSAAAQGSESGAVHGAQGMIEHKRGNESAQFRLFRFDGLDGQFTALFPVHSFDVDREQQRSEGVGWSRVAAGFTNPPSLIAFVSPPGHGKTTALCNFGVQVLKAGQLGTLLTARPRWRVPGLQTFILKNSDAESIGQALALLDGARPDFVLVDEPQDRDAMRLLVEYARFCVVAVAIHGLDPITAMVEFGAKALEPATVTTFRLGIFGLRIIDLLCSRCKNPVQLRGTSLRNLENLGFKAGDRVYEPRGCEACRGTGYSGRELIIQTLRPNSELLSLSVSGGALRDLREAAKRAGMMSLTSCVLPLLEAGNVSYRVARTLTHGFNL